MTEWLDVSFNTLVGVVHTELGQLTKLSTSRVVCYIYDGAGALETYLFSLFCITILEEGLDLWGNGFTGTLPTELGLLTNLGTHSKWCYMLMSD